MPSPVIDPRTSILSIAEGGAFNFRPAATNSPASWAASGLPDGLSINTSTGAITGTVTAESGIYHVTLTATNGSGTGELVLVIPVFVSPDVITGELTVEINVDIITGAVTVVGMVGAELSPPTTEQRDDGLRRAVMLVKDGDRFPVSIGFTRDGVLQDLDLATLRMKAKEFEPEGALNLLDDNFEKVGEGASTRYKSVINVEHDQFAAILSNYEADSGTYFDALAEIEISILVSSPTFGQTKVESLSPSLAGGTSQTDTFVFSDLPKIAGPVTYTADLALDIIGRSTQDASLSLSFSVSWNSSIGAFVVSGITGDTLAQGADETASGHWRSKLTHVSAVGTATGVTITTKTEASDDFDGEVIVLNLATNPNYSISGGVIIKSDPYTAENIEAQDSTLSIVDPLILAGKNAATLKAELNALTHFVNSVADVRIDSTEQLVFIELAEGSALYRIEDHLGTVRIYTKEASPSHAHAGTVSVTLEGDLGAHPVVYRRTSETFILRTERGIIAEA